MWALYGGKTELICTCWCTYSFFFFFWTIIECNFERILFVRTVIHFSCELESSKVSCMHHARRALRIHSINGCLWSYISQSLTYLIQITTEIRFFYDWKCSQLEMLSSLFIVFLHLLLLQINLGIQYNKVEIKMSATKMNKKANKRKLSLIHGENGDFKSKTIDNSSIYTITYRIYKCDFLI